MPPRRRPSRSSRVTELRVLVSPGVASELPLTGPRNRPRREVATSGRDHRPRAGEQTLRVARHLRARHREAHPPEQPTSAALANLPLRLDVGLGRRGADRIQTHLRRKSTQLGSRHARILHREGDQDPRGRPAHRPLLRRRPRSAARTRRGPREPAGGRSQPPRHLDSEGPSRPSPSRASSEPTVPESSRRSARASRVFTRRPRRRQPRDPTRRPDHRHRRAYRRDVLRAEGHPSRHSSIHSTTPFRSRKEQRSRSSSRPRTGCS